MKKTLPLPEIFIVIDENGRILVNEQPLKDPLQGKIILQSLQKAENSSYVSQHLDQPCLVEYFDEPLIAEDIEPGKKSWKIFCAYQTEFEMDLKDLVVDEWDRFHGRTREGIPLVLSEKAQDRLFNLVDEFDDDSLTVNGKTYSIENYFSDSSELNDKKWWGDVYDSEENPRWNLAEPAEALKDMLPRLKLPKSRILVLGSGEGHDAALFAREGHVVTAVDISPQATERAQKLYGQFENLTFATQDLFEFANSTSKKFDLIFEHTCYCAINPIRRQELVKTWTRLLEEQGKLMAILFCMDQRQGPPFGGSEWEYRKRLQKSFDFLFWGRWRKSLPRRQGRELFVLAMKKNS